MSLILSGTDGLSDVDGSASTPAIRGTDTNTGIFFPAADTIAFAEGGAEVARFDSSGRLLVNRTATGGSVFDSCNVQVTGNLSVSRSDPEFILQNTGSAARIWRILGSSDSGATAALRFYDDTAGTERMRIDSSGRLLVGLTSTSQDTRVYFKSTGGAGYSVINSWNDADSGTRFHMEFRDSSGASSRGSITTNGSNTTYSTSSDYRLKENIVPMTGALSKVSALKPCTYTWIDNGQNGEGFIAHELAEVVPQAVIGEKDAVNEDGSIKSQSIDTSFLVATLTAAIQEQQAIITDLKSRIEALEAK
jgi:hypothetical protein